MNNRTPLQSHRRAAGLSQEDVAAACEVYVSTVRRWEAGESRPQPKHRQQLAAVLELTPLELDRLLEASHGHPAGPLTMPPAFGPEYDPDVTVSDPNHAALEWILDPTGPLHHLASPAQRGSRRVGTDLIDQVASRVVRWRRADDTTPTHLLLPEVLDEVTRLETVLRHHNYTEITGKRLHALLAEVLQLAGFMAIDLGRRKTGERCYRDGLQAARIAGDRALAAQLVSCEAYQRSSRGEDAFLLARAALHGAGETTPLVHILFQERVAWAAAQTGRVDECRRALADVDETYASVGTVPEVDWVYWLDRGESDVMAARCLLRLGEAGRAAALLRPVIARYPDHPREKALYLSWLAQAYLAIGQLDAADSVLGEIDELQVESHRLRMRLRELQR